MKKLLKRIASLLVCGAVFLTGCGVTSTSLPGELKAPNTDYPETVNIYAPDFFTNSSAANADQARQQWLDEMSERYGVKFNIVSSLNYGTAYETTVSSSTDSKNTDSSVSDLETGDKKYYGFVSVSTDSIRKLKVAIENGSYMPLENYLKNNAVWNALPDDFKSLFEIDGHIYAIPTSVSRVQNVRIIHNEALEETGITVTDLDSFHDFAVTYAKETGKAVSNLETSEVMDILNAFGLYPGNDPENPFSYDPTEGCFVDWMTKDAAVDALEYLRELYNAGAICIKRSSDIPQLFKDGILASKYDPNFDYADCTTVLTLNPEYPQVISTTISGFAMNPNTPQPKETINLLIDMLFGSEESYLECRLGSSDNYTINSDGTITVKMAQDPEGNYVTPAMPNLAGELSDIFPYSEADLLYSKNGVVATQSEDAVKNNDRLKLLNDSLKNGVVVEIPLKFQIIKSATYDANMNDPENNVGTTLYYIYFLTAIMRSVATVQEVVDAYKEKMLNAGGNQMLDEMNAAIGKQTAYYYG